MARSDDSGPWVKQKKPAATRIAEMTGLFGQPIDKTHAEPISLPVEVVGGVESTPATFLSWDTNARRDFVERMRGHRGQANVDLTQQTMLTMAPVLTTP